MEVHVDRFNQFDPLDPCYGISLWFFWLAGLRRLVHLARQFNLEAPATDIDRLGFALVVEQVDAVGCPDEFAGIGVMEWAGGDEDAEIIIAALSAAVVCDLDTAAYFGGNDFAVTDIGELGDWPIEFNVGYLPADGRNLGETGIGFVGAEDGN